MTSPAKSSSSCRRQNQEIVSTSAPISTLIPNPRPSPSPKAIIWQPDYLLRSLAQHPGAATHDPAAGNMSFLNTHPESMTLRQSIEVPADQLAPDHSNHAIERQMRADEGTSTAADPAGGEETLSMGIHCDGHDHNGPVARISSSSKLASQTVGPFLAKHIPAQYAPGGPPSQPAASKQDPNTRYCYRHHPNSNCQRTADEPKMENLQRELETLPQDDQQAISHVWSLFSAAPAKHRNLMLQGVLTQCCFPQLSYLSTAVRDLIRIDYIAALPNEISLKILGFLDCASLCKAALVSRAWRDRADDDVVWHKMCEQHIDRKCTECGWGLPLLERKRLSEYKADRKEKLKAKANCLSRWSPRLTPLPEAFNTMEESSSFALPGSCKRKAPDDSPPSSSSSTSKRSKIEPTSSGLDLAQNLRVSPEPQKFRPWKDVYRDRFQVSKNWKKKRPSIMTFRGHTNGVMCLQFDENILATGSYDNTIKIWDIKTGDCLRTLRAHTAPVRTLQFDDQLLMSGSLDHTIKIWNWRTGQVVSTLEGHTAPIVGLHFDCKAKEQGARDYILASGSRDTTVKVWNFKDPSSSITLVGHTDDVNAVKIDHDSQTVLSSSDDCTIRLWDLKTRKTMQILDGHVGQVQQITVMPHEYEPEEAVADVADSDSIFAGWDRNRTLPPRYIFTAALDNNIRLWDVFTGKCLKTIFGHVEGVWALAGDTIRLVSGAQDKTTKVWDAVTGKNEGTYTGHRGPVTCIGLSDSQFVTGSEDSEVRLYSFVPKDDDTASEAATPPGS